MAPATVALAFLIYGLADRGDQKLAKPPHLSNESSFSGSPTADLKDGTIPNRRINNRSSNNDSYSLTATASTSDEKQSFENIVVENTITSENNSCSNGFTEKQNETNDEVTKPVTINNGSGDGLNSSCHTEEEDENLCSIADLLEPAIDPSKIHITSGRVHSPETPSFPFLSIAFKAQLLDQYPPTKKSSASFSFNHSQRAKTTKVQKESNAIPKEESKNDPKTLHITSSAVSTPTLSRVPTLRVPTVTVPPGLEIFCFPQGLNLTLIPKAPQYFVFVTTSESGKHLFGHTLLIYEPLTKAQRLALKLRIDEAREKRYLKEQQAFQEMLMKEEATEKNVHRTGDSIPTVDLSTIPTGDSHAIPTGGSHTISTGDSIRPLDGASRRRRKRRLSSHFILPENLTIYAPKCLVILANTCDYFHNYKVFLTHLYQLSLTPSMLPLERVICNFISEIPLPPRGMPRTEVQWSLPIASSFTIANVDEEHQHDGQNKKNKHSSSFEQRHHDVLSSSSFLRFTRPPLHNPINLCMYHLSSSSSQQSPPIMGMGKRRRLPSIPYASVFSALGVDILLQLFTAVLLEKRILLHSSQISLLTGTAEVLRQLIYPFQWRHVYIPVLPWELITVLQAPIPFIVGLQTPDELTNPNNNHRKVRVPTIEVSSSEYISQGEDNDFVEYGRGGQRTTMANKNPNNDRSRNNNRPLSSMGSSSSSSSLKAKAFHSSNGDTKINGHRKKKKKPLLSPRSYEKNRRQAEASNLRSFLASYGSIPEGIIIVDIDKGLLWGAKVEGLEVLGSDKSSSFSNNHNHINSNVSESAASTNGLGGGRKGRTRSTSSEKSTSSHKTSSSKRSSSSWFGGIGNIFSNNTSSGGNMVATRGGRGGRKKTAAEESSTKGNTAIRSSNASEKDRRFVKELCKSLQNGSDFGNIPLPGESFDWQRYPFTCLKLFNNRRTIRQSGPRIHHHNNNFSSSLSTDDQILRHDEEGMTNNIYPCCASNGTTWIDGLGLDHSTRGWISLPALPQREYTALRTFLLTNVFGREGYQEETVEKEEENLDTRYPRKWPFVKKESQKYFLEHFDEAFLHQSTFANDIPLVDIDWLLVRQAFFLTIVNLLKSYRTYLNFQDDSTVTVDTTTTKFEKNNDLKKRSVSAVTNDNDGGNKKSDSSKRPGAKFDKIGFLKAFHQERKMSTNAGPARMSNAGAANVSRSHSKKNIISSPDQPSTACCHFFINPGYHPSSRYHSHKESERTGIRFMAALLKTQAFTTFVDDRVRVNTVDFTTSLEGQAIGEVIDEFEDEYPKREGEEEDEKHHSRYFDDNDNNQQGGGNAVKTATALHGSPAMLMSQRRRRRNSAGRQQSQKKRDINNVYFDVLFFDEAILGSERRDALQRNEWSRVVKSLQMKVGKKKAKTKKINKVGKKKSKIRRDKSRGSKEKSQGKEKGHVKNSQLKQGEDQQKVVTSTEQPHQRRGSFFDRLAERWAHSRKRFTETRKTKFGGNDGKELGRFSNLGVLSAFVATMDGKTTGAAMNSKPGAAVNGKTTSAVMNGETSSAVMNSKPGAAHIRSMNFDTSDKKAVNSLIHKLITVYENEEEEDGNSNNTTGTIMIPNHAMKESFLTIMLLKELENGNLTITRNTDSLFDSQERSKSQRTVLAREVDWYPRKDIDTIVKRMSSSPRTSTSHQKNDVTNNNLSTHENNDVTDNNLSTVIDNNLSTHRSTSMYPHFVRRELHTLESGNLQSSWCFDYNGRFPNRLNKQLYAKPRVLPDLGDDRIAAKEAMLLGKHVRVLTLQKELQRESASKTTKQQNKSFNQKGERRRKKKRRRSKMKGSRGAEKNRGILLGGKGDDQRVNQRKEKTRNRNRRQWKKRGGSVGESSAITLPRESGLLTETISLTRFQRHPSNNGNASAMINGNVNASALANGNIKASALANGNVNRRSTSFTSGTFTSSLESCLLATWFLLYCGIIGSTKLHKKFIIVNEKVWDMDTSGKPKKTLSDLFWKRQNLGALNVAFRVLNTRLNEWRSQWSAGGVGGVLATAGGIMNYAERYGYVYSNSNVKSQKTQSNNQQEQQEEDKHVSDEEDYFQDIQALVQLHRQSRRRSSKFHQRLQKDVEDVFRSLIFACGRCADHSRASEAVLAMRYCGLLPGSYLYGWLVDAFQERKLTYDWRDMELSSSEEDGFSSDGEHFETENETERHGDEGDNPKKKKEVSTRSNSEMTSGEPTKGRGGGGEGRDRDSIQSNNKIIGSLSPSIALALIGVETYNHQLKTKHNNTYYDTHDNVKPQNLLTYDHGDNIDQHDYRVVKDLAELVVGIQHDDEEENSQTFIGTSGETGLDTAHDDQKEASISPQERRRNQEEEGFGSDQDFRKENDFSEGEEGDTLLDPYLSSSSSVSSSCSSSACSSRCSSSARLYDDDGITSDDDDDESHMYHHEGEEDSINEGCTSEDISLDVTTDDGTTGVDCFNDDDDEEGEINLITDDENPTNAASREERSRLSRVTSRSSITQQGLDQTPENSCTVDTKNKEEDHRRIRRQKGHQERKSLRRLEKLDREMILEEEDAFLKEWDNFLGSNEYERTLGHRNRQRKIHIPLTSPRRRNGIPNDALRKASATKIGQITGSAMLHRYRHAHCRLINQNTSTQNTTKRTSMNGKNLLAQFDKESLSEKKSDSDGVAKNNEQQEKSGDHNGRKKTDSTKGGFEDCEKTVRATNHRKSSLSIDNNTNTDEAKKNSCTGNGQDTNPDLLLKQNQKRHARRHLR
eukprot:g2206.t1